MANIGILNLHLKNKKDFVKLETFIKSNIKKTESGNDYLDFSEIFNEKENKYNYAMVWFDQDTKYGIPGIGFEAKRHIPEIGISNILKQFNIKEGEFSASYETDYFLIGKIDEMSDFVVVKRFYPYKEMELSMLAEISRQYNIGGNILKKIKKILLSGYYDENKEYYKYKKIKKTLIRINDCNNIKNELNNKYGKYYNGKKINNLSQNKLFNIYNTGLFN